MKFSSKLLVLNTALIFCVSFYHDFVQNIGQKRSEKLLEFYTHPMQRYFSFVSCYFIECKIYIRKYGKQFPYLILALL